MTTHLSNLSLDELAADLPVAEASTAHLAGCEACRARLAQRQQLNLAILARPEAQARLDALVRAPARRRPSYSTVLAIVVPLAAALLLWLAPAHRPEDPTTLKGAASVQLLDAAGVASTHAHPGDTLTLAVGAAGHRFGAVFAVDSAGGISVLYPAAGTAMGPLDGNARQRLTGLDVTPGDTRLVAFFADEPRPLAELQARLADAVKQATPLTDAAQLLLRVD